MTNTKSAKQQVYFATKDLESENMRLRFELQQAKEKICQERRQRSLLEEELAFERQVQANRVRQWNGVAR